MAAAPPRVTCGPVNRACQWLGILVLVGGLTPAALAHAQAGPPALAPNRLRQAIGTGVNWIDDGSGMRLSQGPSAAAESLVGTLGYTLVRIPGGSLARTFDWTAAVDSPRGVGRDFSLRLQPILTGLPEFKRFAARTSMRVMYTLNISDPPSRVVDLIRRWRALAPVAGPDLAAVELGNEEYIEGADARSAARYAATAQPIARELRQAAPAVRIGAVLGSGRTDAWDSVVVAALGPSIDFLVWHRYVAPGWYLGAASYPASVDFFSRIEAELQVKLRLARARRLPILLGEYNIYFSRDGRHENVMLLPRFYLLLANFLHLAVRYDLDGLIKWSLANRDWHTFADINFRGTDQPELSPSGALSRLLNGWLGRQDSVAVVVASPAPWYRVSMILGRAADGTPSLLVQNHDAVETPVRLPPLPGWTPEAWSGLMERDTTLSEVAGAVPATPDGLVAAPPFSVFIVRFRRRG